MPNGKGCWIMTHLYGKVRVSETGKPDYDNWHSAAFNLLPDVPDLTVSRTPSYPGRFSTEYAYDESFGVGLQGEWLQHPSKIKNVESTGTTVRLFEMHMQHSEAKTKSMERHLMDIQEQLKISNDHIAKLAKQVQKMSKPEQMDSDNMRQQNEIGREDIMSIFGTDADASIDTKELDGLLSDYVDPEQDSRFGMVY